ncbi:hypothetical protein GYMLUDRAFT_251631 [Collybiopsis luxurians FD-317 M1]|uniref:Uncharacterized protein n=1 Tax=Collybiopsis luxurians FD-317 M1 TaxID=944289 RepID=A0A0D0ANY4_9AGAR|nr:hypothetical protein GYMLUDRAFT_251631 [Collybiopsis luxurians FD-317 M1]
MLGEGQLQERQSGHSIPSGNPPNHQEDNPRPQSPLLPPLPPLPSPPSPENPPENPPPSNTTEPVLSEIEVIQTAQQFIRALQNASLDNSDLDAHSLENLFNPHQHPLNLDLI